MTPGAVDVALRRFGLLGRPGEARAVAGDPRGALLDQLDRPPPEAPPDLSGTAASLDLYAGRRDAQQARQAARLAEEQGRPPPPPFAGTEVALSTLQARELAWRLRLARETESPLRERLVLFWTNHLTVSGVRGVTATLSGAYEREAIRPHLLGPFEALLAAAALHPAMLFYLDNVASVGRDSPLGRGRRRGVNENLAREILELHALGADGGYAQADVTALAQILSGWVVRVPGGVNATGGEGPSGARFDAARHQPGPKTVLGRTYERDGEGQAEAILRDLARHPSAARHVCRALARHFVSNPPPPALVARLEAAWRAGDGHLRPVTEALLSASEAWEAPMVRLRPPLEFVMAGARLTGQDPEPRRLLNALRAMGQPFYRAPSPAGWDETDDGWATPDGIKTRLDWARQQAFRADRRADPRALAEGLGPGASAATRGVLGGAESPEQGLALLLMSPEVQRR